MNADDRIALILGRLLMQAEKQGDEIRKLSEQIAELQKPPEKPEHQSE